MRTLILNQREATLSFIKKEDTNIYKDFYPFLFIRNWIYFWIYKGCRCGLPVAYVKPVGDVTFMRKESYFLRELI